ncbi:TPA: DoxX family membrane protein [Klebsiella quasipneumoniae subsp. similipneumoniae]
MVKGLLNAVNRTLSHEDAGKLLLRLAVGGLMLFHGLHKLLDGVDGISGMLAAKGLPGFIAYGVLVGAWAIENLVYFFVGALAIALLGAGRYSLAGQSVWR